MGESLEGVCTVRLHYLGHAAFVLEFGDVVVLADYGAPNAWVESGWDSPIHDVGELRPDVATYSHMHHADHFDAARVPAGIPILSAPSETVHVGDVTIEGIPLHEQDLGVADTRAHLLAYRGCRVLHLGDCQADIVHVTDGTHRAWLKATLPTDCDVALIPIESQRRFTSQAVDFVQLLRPRIAVPMHFWSEETLEEFLEFAGTSGEDLTVEGPKGSQLAVGGSPLTEGVRVVPLRPGPFRGFATAP